MTDLTTVAPQELATIQIYETRIDLYKEQVAGGYIGIGQTLIEAKASGVIPHGQWESWVTERTGMTIRHAQRCMQAAREIGEGSPLARLDMSKAMLLLSSGLDEDKRNAIGAAAAEEQVSVSELKRRIEEAREETREAERALAARQSARIEELHRRELQRVREDERAKTNSHAEVVAAQRVESYRKLLTQRDLDLDKAEAARAAAEAAAQTARETAEADARAASANEVAQLRVRLDKADADRRAAQQELLTLKSARAAAAATGADQQGLTLERFVRATRSYLTEVAELPYMGTVLANADSAVRDGYEAQLRRLSDWLQAAQQALRIIVINADKDLDELLRDGLFDREALGG